MGLTYHLYLHPAFQIRLNSIDQMIESKVNMEKYFLLGCLTFCFQVANNAGFEAKSPKFFALSSHFFAVPFLPSLTGTAVAPRGVKAINTLLKSPRDVLIKQNCVAYSIPSVAEIGCGAPRCSREADRRDVVTRCLSRR